MALAPRPARAVALLVAGVLLFADHDAVAIAGFAATVALLFAIGFAEGRLRAVAWAGIFILSAFVADVLWQLGWEPFDRSGEYEPLPQTPFMIVAVPIPMAIIAAGVAARALWRRRPRDA